MFYINGLLYQVHSILPDSTDLKDLDPDPSTFQQEMLDLNPQHCFMFSINVAASTVPGHPVQSSDNASNPQVQGPAGCGSRVGLK